MRFAMATSDRYLGVFDAFVRAGWQAYKFFISSPGQPDKDSIHHQAVIARAERLGLDLQSSPIGDADLEDLRKAGCAALIVASYDWKIPAWETYLQSAVNFHPSPLPVGRGPYPIVRAVLEQRTMWGITCHKISAAFDTGDILAIEHFPLAGDEGHEQLILKLEMAAQRLAAKVATDFNALWQQATAQGPGEYWGKPTLQDRIIDFTAPLETVLRHIRAFGVSESLACLNGTWLIVKRALGWIEDHTQTPGSVAHISGGSIVVAVPDGYVALVDNALAAADVVERLAEAGR